MKKLFVALMLVMLVIGLTPALAEGPRVIRAGSVDTTAAPSEDTVAGEDSPVAMPKPYGQAVMRGDRQMVAQQVQAREQVQERAQEVKEFQQKLRDCKYKIDEDCKLVKAEAKKKAKNFLTNAVDKTLAFLEKAKERITKSKLSEEEKAAAMAEIEAKAEELRNAKTEVEAKEEVDRNELKDAVGRIRNSWGKVRSAIAHKLHMSYAHKFGNTFEKIEKVQAKLGDNLAKMQQKGMDISNVVVTGFDTKVGEAKNAYEQAKGLLGQAKDASEEESKALMKQAREKLKEAHEYMKQSREELKNILQQMRNAMQRRAGQA